MSKLTAIVDQAQTNGSLAALADSLSSCSLIFPWADPKVVEQIIGVICWYIEGIT